MAAAIALDVLPGTHASVGKTGPASNSPRLRPFTLSLGEVDDAADSGPSFYAIHIERALRLGSRPVHLHRPSSTLPWAKPTRQRTQTCHGFHRERRSSPEVIPLTSACHHPCCLGRSQQRSEPRPAKTAIINSAPVRKSSRSSPPAIIHAALGEANKAADPGLPRLPPRTASQPRCRPTSPRLPFIHAALGEADKAANPDLPPLPLRTTVQPGSHPTYLGLPSSTLPWAKPTRQRTQTCQEGHHGRCSSWEAVPLTSTHHHPPCLGRSRQGSDPDPPRLPSSTGAPVRMSSRSSWPAIIPPTWAEAKQGSVADPSTTAIINGASGRKSSRSSRACHHRSCTCSAFDQFDSTSLIQSQLGRASDPLHASSCIGTSRPSHHRSFAARSRPPNDWR
jgi:hypothetical protein